MCASKQRFNIPERTIEGADWRVKISSLNDYGRGHGGGDIFTGVCGDAVAYFSRAENLAGDDARVLSANKIYVGSGREGK